MCLVIFVWWEAGGCTTAVFGRLLPGDIHKIFLDGVVLMVVINFFFLVGFPARVNEVHPYGNTYTSTAWKISPFIISDWSNFYFSRWDTATEVFGLVWFLCLMAYQPL